VLFWASACAALAMHCGALLWFMLGPEPDSFSGAGGYRLEAINVEIVPSALLDTHELEQNSAQTATDVAVTDEKPSEEKSENPRDVPVIAEDMPELAKEKPAAPPKPMSGPSGPSEASPGAIQRYAAQVRATLARKQPKGNGRVGTVSITFSIVSSGSVSSARLSGSSGDTALDQAVLNAVLHAPFPLPPIGMTDTQLTYVVPFHFKPAR
jgi:protein TonB